MCQTQGLNPIPSQQIVFVLLRKSKYTVKDRIREEEEGFHVALGCGVIDSDLAFQDPTIIEFLDVRTALDFVNGSVLRLCFLGNCIPKDHILVPKE